MSDRTIEEAKKELHNMIGNNMHKSEAVFLNMALYTYGSSLGSSLGLKKRTVEDEVYPGCPRRTWIKSGPCEGIIPPRAYDLAGSILPLKERDHSMLTP